MELYLSDMVQYIKDNIFLVIVVHAFMLVAFSGLTLNVIKNWRLEKANTAKLRVKNGTYMSYINRDLKTMLILFIIYIVAVPFLFGFVDISLY